MVESWAAFTVFQIIAFFLFLYVVVRSVYRCYTYHDCCRRCKKRPEAAPGGPAAKPGKPASSGPAAQSSGGGGGNAGPALGPNSDRIESELFDPSRPLELPIHGIHYPDPLEEEAASEAGSSGGGHNLDFTVENVGYDEPDGERRKRPTESSAATVDDGDGGDGGDGGRPEGGESAVSPEAGVPPSGDPTSSDQDGRPVPGADASPPTGDSGGQLVPGAGSRPDLVPDSDSGNYQNYLPRPYAAAANESDGLVVEENSYETVGIDNPVVFEYV